MAKRGRKKGTGNPDFGTKYKFQKGDPRINRAGRKVSPLKKIMSDLLLTSDDDDKTELAEMLRELFKMAKNANHQHQLAAIREVLDRLYGKPKQSIELTGDEEPVQPITGFKIIRGNGTGT